MDNKSMPLFVCIIMLFPAVIFDLISIVPFLGFFSSVFIFFTRLIFWIIGYRSGSTATILMVGTMILELIPGFSILPGCIAFVVGFYLVNKASGVIKTVIQKKKGRKNAHKSDDMTWEEVSVA